MAELQLHGGRAVVQAIFDVLARAGLRLAEPGEFIRRAFQNGKLDLTEVEGLADLIAAETEVQRRQAVGQAGGALAKRAEAWRETLIDLRAEIEARLDFSDEGDVAEALPADFWPAGRGAEGGDGGGARGRGFGRAGARGFSRGDPRAAECRKILAAQCPVAPRRGDRHRRSRARRGTCWRCRSTSTAIRSLLFDTAGLREADSLAEREGVRRARRTAESADLILWLEDCTLPVEPPPDLCPIGRSGGFRRRSTLRPPAPGSDLGISVVTRSGLGRADRQARRTRRRNRSAAGTRW